MTCEGPGGYRKGAGRVPCGVSADVPADVSVGVLGTPAETRPLGRGCWLVTALIYLDRVTPTHGENHDSALVTALPWRPSRRLPRTFPIAWTSGWASAPGFPVSAGCRADGPGRRMADSQVMKPCPSTVAGPCQRGALPG